MQRNAEYVPRKVMILLFALIILAALTLRLVGITFGLPLQLHPDEWSQVDTAQRMLGGDLNPHFFRYPSLTINQLFVIDGSLKLAADAARRRLTTDTFYLVGRLVTAAYGVFAVAAVFWLGKLVGGRAVGLIAALVMAISAEPIVQSHYATVDMVLTCWITLSLAFGIWACSRNRSFVPAGIAAGLAIGTKYTGVLLLPSLFVLVLWQSAGHATPTSARRLAIMRWGCILVGISAIVLVGFLPTNSVLDMVRRWTTDGVIEGEYIGFLNAARWLGVVMGLGLLGLGLGSIRWAPAKKILSLLATPQLWLLLASAAVVFAITSPFFFLDLPTAFRDFIYEYRHVTIGAAAQFSTADPLYTSLLPTGLLPDPGYYWQWWITQNGWGLTAAAVAGIFFLSRTNKPAAVASGLFVVITFLILTRGANKADRYALVALPILYVWAAMGIVGACAYLPRRVASLAALALTLVILVVPITASAQAVQSAFLLPDTRSMAYQWAAAHLPTNSTVLREDRTPDLEHTTAPFSIIARTSAFDTETLDEWKRQGVEYVMLGPLGDWYTANAVYYPRVAQEYRKLQVEGQLLATFQADGVSAVGPTIRVYKLQ